jgi:hypothetical protein
MRGGLAVSSHFKLKWVPIGPPRLMNLNLAVAEAAGARAVAAEVEAERAAEDEGSSSGNVGNDDGGDDGGGGSGGSGGSRGSRDDDGGDDDADRHGDGDASANQRGDAESAPAGAGARVRPAVPVPAPPPVLSAAVRAELLAMCTGDSRLLFLGGGAGGGGGSARAGAAGGGAGGAAEGAAAGAAAPSGGSPCIVAVALQRALLEAAAPDTPDGLNDPAGAADSGFSGSSLAAASPQADYSPDAARPAGPAAGPAGRSQNGSSSGSSNASFFSLAGLEAAAKRRRWEAAQAGEFLNLFSLGSACASGGSSAAQRAAADAAAASQGGWRGYCEQLWRRQEAVQRAAGRLQLQWDRDEARRRRRQAEGHWAAGAAADTGGGGGGATARAASWLRGAGQTRETPAWREQLWEQLESDNARALAFELTLEGVDAAQAEPPPVTVLQPVAEDGHKPGDGDGGSGGGGDGDGDGDSSTPPRRFALATVCPAGARMRVAGSYSHPQRTCVACPAGRITRRASTLSRCARCPTGRFARRAKAWGRPAGARAGAGADVGGADAGAGAGTDDSAGALGWRLARAAAQCAACPIGKVRLAPTGVHCERMPCCACLLPGLIVPVRTVLLASRFSPAAPPPPLRPSPFEQFQAAEGQASCSECPPVAGKQMAGTGAASCTYA